MKDKTQKSFNKKMWFTIIGIVLICIGIICFIIFLLKGQTTITNTNTDAKVQERLVCESHITHYPLFDYDYSTSKSLKINAIFEDKEVNSISLIYKLTYDDPEKLTMSKAQNHAALNLTSQGEGLGPDAYNAKYNVIDNTLQLSLYASGNDIDTKALKYFMLDRISNTPYTIDVISKVYAAQGLSCKIEK